MSIQPVQENKSHLGDGIKSAIIGGAVGYVSKYALPLTTQEKDADYKKIVKDIEINARNAKRNFLKSVKGIEQKSLSQDAYINSTRSFIKSNTRIYNMLVKNARPTMPFVGVGIATGLLISFIKNVFSTEIK